MSTRCFAALLHALFLINADTRQVCHDNILAALGNEFIGPTRFERDLGAVGNDAERVDGGDALDVGKRNVRFAGLNVETVGFKDDALVCDVQTPADGFGPAPHIRRRVEKKLFGGSVFHWCVHRGDNGVAPARSRHSRDLTAATMASASILAQCISSAGLPEPGIP